jgi:hypothetical protein
MLRAALAAVVMAACGGSPAAPEELAFRPARERELDRSRSAC